MVVRKLLILSLFAFLAPSVLFKARGQQPTACTILGQNPSTAFPVCGTSVFKQDTVHPCGGRLLPVPCRDRAQYSDINPFWYKFTCFKSGTLGFMITPNTPTDDYDWQIFDITGHDPNDVYTQANLFVSANWSSNPDGTGTASNNNGNINCAGPTYPNVNSMPTLTVGHDYIMLVSHFTNDNQSGYSLVFSGGTASITDTTTPAIKTAESICFGETLRIALNKKMKCSSLAADGSDFTVSPLPPGVKVVGATPVDCNGGFDLDTLILSLSGPLVPGSYKVAAAIGSDGNSLLDVCGNQIPPNQSVPFTMVYPTATLMDSLVQPACAPNDIQLVFKKGIQCSSIASDGSDFTVTGPYPVTVTGFTANCDALGLAHTFLVRLSAPLQKAGNFTINLKTGSDGNTLLDECGILTPPASLPFSVVDTVSAEAFLDPVTLGCKMDTIDFSYPIKDGVNYWRWVFDGSDTSLQQSERRVWSAVSTHAYQLIVSNGVCSDTTRGTLTLDNQIRAAFEAPNIICPTDFAQFRNNSKGLIDFWSWDFVDGSTSTDQTPPDHLFPKTGVETGYDVRLIAGNNMGCYDTAVQKVNVLRSCYIAVPTAFTPNGDGLNDYLYPLNAFKADNLNFQVFNRQGQLVFQTHDWTKKWDGRVQGHAAPAGTYAWFLEYVDRDTQKKFFQKGTAILIR
ncbi:MAG: gliding motility-associated C-terminal domain-containing protein [Bacteroidetes bacterium]|nr:gliding motility-associated C-terminal domain-containing protein [Bacteroidota bacterium]